MTQIVTELLTALLRYAIVWGLGILLAKHVITEDQQQRFAQFFTDPTVLLAIAGALVTVGFALRAVIRARLKLLTALASETPTTEAQVAQAVNAKEAPALSTPPDTVPQRPKKE